MRPTINLLHNTPQGHTWIQVVLDLEPEAFRREDVRSLRRDLARFSDLPMESVSTVAVSRWMPIIDLQLPDTQARRLVQLFESDPDRLVEVSRLPIRRIRSEADAAERFSRRHVGASDLWAEWLQWLSSWFDSLGRDSAVSAVETKSDLQTEAPWRKVLKAAKGFGFALVMGLATIFGSVLWLVYRAAAFGWTQARSLVERSGVSTKSVETFRQSLGARMSAGSEGLRSSRTFDRALHRGLFLVEVSARTHVEGTRRIQEEIWPDPVRYSYSRVVSLFPSAKDFKTLAIPILETVLVSGVVFWVWLYGTLLEAGRGLRVASNDLRGENREAVDFERRRQPEYDESDDLFSRVFWILLAFAGLLAVFFQ